MKGTCMTLWKTIEHNRYLVLGLLAALLAVGVFAGCEVTTASLFRPDESVTATELQREIVVAESDLSKRQAALNADIEAHNAAVETAQGDLASKAAFRTKIVETIGSLGIAAAEGTLSPAAAPAAVVQLLTVAAAGGLVADNRRKDKVIKAKIAPTEIDTPAV